MALSWILACIVLVFFTFLLYLRHELVKVQRASADLYFILSFEPLLVEEVYELARLSKLEYLT